jgi:probable phosphoglycerate mutase
MHQTPKKIVYFFRHGQSEDNILPIFQALNSPLSELGKIQAERLAQRAVNLSFELFIASPLERSRQTAEIISQVTKKKVEYSDLFVELMKPSAVYGKAYTDQAAQNLWRSWEKSLHTTGVRIEDGENFDDLLVRIDQALLFLQNQTQTSIAVVTHGYFLRALILRVLFGGNFSGEILRNAHKMASMANTGITVLEYFETSESQPEWRLSIYNDHSHLADEVL